VAKYITARLLYTVYKSAERLTRIVLAHQLDGQNQLTSPVESHNDLSLGRLSSLLIQRISMPPLIDFRHAIVPSQVIRSGGKCSADRCELGSLLSLMCVTNMHE